MLGLPSLTIWSKLAIMAAWTVTVAVVVGAKVHEHEYSKYEGILLNEKVHLVEKVRTVTILDKAAVEASVAKASEDLKRQLEDERLMNEILKTHANDAPILTDSELHQWNDQNRRLMGDAPAEVPTGGGQLPNTIPVSDGKASGPVGKQN